MADTIPVAGAIVSASSDELLAVEAAPESEATRAYKDVARHVFRFVQEVQWSGSDHAVRVRILGSVSEQRAIAANVGLLLAPLADIAIASDPEIRVAFDLPVDADHDQVADYVTPRDKVWLVPADHLDIEATSERFAITFGPTLGPDRPADLVLVAVPGGSSEVTLPPVDDLTEFAAVLVDSPPDYPAEIRIGSARG